MSGRSDFRPAASLKTLRCRAELLAVVRKFFHDRSYWEVETPILSRDVIIDAHLDPFVTCWQAEAQSEGVIASAEDRLFLQTSPEAGMKRLLAAGAEAIFQISRAMRNGEFGRYHNPEFTLTEWYHVDQTHHDQMDLVEDLVRTVFEAAGNHRMGVAGVGLSEAKETPGLRTSSSSPGHPKTIKSDCAQRGTIPVPSVGDRFERLTYDAAFERYAGRCVLGLESAKLAALAAERGLVPPPSLAEDDRDGWLNFLLADVVEPNLGRDAPVFLYDYPASQAALATIRREQPPVAERFELYICGIEICNGYRELTDPEELQQRMRMQGEIRARAGRSALPECGRLLDAMQTGLPPCAGVALGFDRLVMLAANMSSLADVIAFPFDRA